MRTFPLLTQRVAAGLAFILGITGAALNANSASAAVGPTVEIGTPTGAGVVDGVVTTESAVTVPITISGFNAATKLDVKISVPVGEGYFSVDPGATGIVADVGYTDRTEVTEYAFNGTVADVTSVLSSGVTWVAPATSTGDITVSVAQTESGLYYNHENGHYYKPVNDSAVTWGEAVDQADNTSKYGMVGYLATVTSRQENDFITYNTTTSSMWLGGSDAGGSNGSTYTWRTGPESGQQFWSGDANGSVSNGMYAGWQLGEPSNTRYFWNFGFSNDYENNTVINWEQQGRWNDLMNDPRNRDFNDDQVNWYLIEYGGMGADVPTALIADDTETLEASDSILFGTMSGGIFTPGAVSATWANTDPKSFAIDLERFTNTSASQLAVTLSLPANSGTFTIPVTTGLTLETGYSSFTAQSAIGFVGAKAAVITALGNLVWNPPATFGTVTAAVSVAEKEPGIFYNPDNGHYYQVKTWGGNTSVSTASSFANAQTFAGMTGYLATITTDAENDFIANHTTAANAWIGATDDTSYVNNVSDQRFDDREGSWHWFTGPEAGREFWYGESGGSTRNGLFENWASGEPNNEPRNLFDSVGEDFAVTNFNGAIGFWNDALNDANGVNAAIIEYGGMPTEPNKSKAAATTATFLHAIEPDAPTLSDVEAGDESISATFTDGDANGESIDVRQYTLDGGTTWVGVTPTANQFSIDGLENGETYSLCIRAANLIGYSESSNCVDVTPATIPDAPTLGDVETGDESISATFTDGADNGDSINARQYTLDGGTNWVAVTPVAGAFTITGLNNGQTYSLCIRAENSIGFSASSTCVDAKPATTPDSPVLSNVETGDETITATFTDGDSNGEAINSRQYSLDGGATWVSVTPVAGAFTITGLNNGQTYSLCIRAANLIGESFSSSCVDATPATVPDAPVLSDLRPRENGLRGTVEPGAYDGGSGVTAWEYQLNSGSWIEFADDVTFDGYVRIGSGLTNGQEYTVCVRAENSAGTSSASNCETVTPAPATEPSEPEITAIVADTTSATITVAEPSDGGADLVLFEYSLDDGATWSEAPEATFPPLRGFSSVIGSVPTYFAVGVTQTWVIDELSPGRSYAFKVRVTNDAGFTSTSDTYRFTTLGGGLAMTGASFTLNLLMLASALVIAGAILRRRKNEFGFSA
jgi:hypothetical protein